MAEKTDTRVQRGGVAQGFFLKILRILAQCAVQPFAFTLAVAPPVIGGDRIDQVQAFVPVNVTALQPAIERWQVMGAGGGEGVIRPGQDGLEVRAVVLLEQQHTHAENGPFAELFTQAFRDRTQVFTQDDGLMAHRLKGDQTQQVIHRVVQISALVRRGAQRDDPQALQPQHMVDAQATGMGKVGAQHFDKGAEAAAFQALGGESRDAPALPRAVEQVGWGAHRQLRQQFVLTAPGLAPCTVGAHRQVGDQTDGHAAGPRRGLRAVEGLRDQPLAERVVGDEVLVLFSKAQQGRAVRVA